MLPDQTSNNERADMTPTRLLFVDDEPVIRASFVRDLELEEFAVVAVADGAEAILALGRQQFDVVVTDLVMPGIDGFGVLKAAKRQSPQTSVVILTGYGDMRSAIDSLRLGADDFTLKPCEIEELVFRIRRCLEKYSLLQALALKNQQLEEEMELRRRAEAELEQRVADRTADLHESNIALKVLLNKREEDRGILAEQVLANTGQLVEPLLERLRKSGLNEAQQTLVEILGANVRELTSPFASKLSSRMTRLTPAEIQVANLVKLGKRTKEIAEIMHLAAGTISIHRKNIRKKLELTHQKTNLQTMLSINS
jgi:DNA-binding NarL/FixJ family response regulator